MSAMFLYLANKGYEKAGKTLCLENAIKTVFNQPLQGTSFEMRRGNALEASG
jgi:hypothetical protein